MMWKVRRGLGKTLHDSELSEYSTAEWFYDYYHILEDEKESDQKTRTALEFLGKCLGAIPDKPEQTRQYKTPDGTTVKEMVSNEFDEIIKLEKEKELGED